VVREWEAEGALTADAITVVGAIAKYLADCEARNLTEATMLLRAYTIMRSSASGPDNSGTGTPNVARTSDGDMPIRRACSDVRVSPGAIVPGCRWHATTVPAASTAARTRGSWKQEAMFDRAPSRRATGR
jgi:hypothetical protein